MELVVLSVPEGDSVVREVTLVGVDLLGVWLVSQEIDRVLKAGALRHIGRAAGRVRFVHID